MLLSSSSIASGAIIKVHCFEERKKKKKTLILSILLNQIIRSHAKCQMQKKKHQRRLRRNAPLIKWINSPSFIHLPFPWERRGGEEGLFLSTNLQLMEVRSEIAFSCTILVVDFFYHVYLTPPYTTILYCTTITYQRYGTGEPERGFIRR